MRLSLLVTLFLLFPPLLFAQGPSAPAFPGQVWYVDWVHVPGISSSGSYTVSWGAASGATDYELEEDTNPNFAAPALLYQGPAFSFGVGGRANGTYYYRVRGINTTYSTQGAYTACDHPHVVDSTLGSGPAIPAAPASISVPANSGSGLIPVTWSSVSGITTYDVAVAAHDSRMLGGPPRSNLAVAATGLTQTSYTHTGADRLEYWFAARSTVSVASYTLYSLWSPVSTMCFVFLVGPGAPAFLTVPPTSTTGTYNLSWGAAASAGAYELEEDTNGGFTNPVQIYQGTALSFQVTGRPSGTYYYRVRGTNGGFPGTGPYTNGGNPCVVTTVGTLTLSKGAVNFPRTEAPGATNVPALQLGLSADFVENITVNGLTVTDGGTLTLATDLAAAKLYADVNANGLVDAGDNLLSTAGAPSGNTVTFGSIATTIAANGSATWLVVYDVAAGAPLGGTLQASIWQNGDVTATGSANPSPWIMGAPVTGAAITLGTIGSLTVSLGPGNPMGASVDPGDTDVPVLQLLLDASSVEVVNITSLAISGAGPGDDSTGIAGANLYLDADSDDAFDSQNDTLLAGPVSYAVDDGKVTFSFNVTLPAGGRTSMFVVYDFDAAAVPGTGYRAGFATNADITANGVSSGQPVTVSGAPAWGNDFTLPLPPPPPPPPADRRSGRCGGGTTASGGDALLGLALLAALLVLVRRAAVRRC
ncbi:MAG: phage tail protein [Planctomycetota bacterium]|jgi:hypothetical protein